jgi:hypothetical protein
MTAKTCPITRTLRRRLKFKLSFIGFRFQGIPDSHNAPQCWHADGNNKIVSGLFHQKGKWGGITAPFSP